MGKINGPTMPWHVGVSGGATPAVKREAQVFARGILESDEYRAKLRTRALAGDLPPAVETMLWHYAYGKPAETLNVNTGAEDYSALTTTELIQTIESLQKELEEAIAVENSIPAEFKVA